MIYRCVQYNIYDLIQSRMPQIADPGPLHRRHVHARAPVEQRAVLEEGTWLGEGEGVAGTS